MGTCLGPAQHTQAPGNWQTGTVSTNASYPTSSRTLAAGPTIGQDLPQVDPGVASEQMVPCMNVDPPMEAFKKDDDPS